MLLEFYRQGTEKVNWDVLISSDGRHVAKARAAKRVKRIVVELPDAPSMPAPIALAMINQIIRYDLAVVTFYGFPEGLWRAGRAG